jgi:hypothetical protein
MNPEAGLQQKKACCPGRTVMLGTPERVTLRAIVSAEDPLKPEQDAGRRYDRSRVNAMLCCLINKKVSR